MSNAPLSPNNNLGPLFTLFLEDAFGMALQNAVLLHIGIDVSGPDDRDTFVSCGVVAGLPARWNLFHQKWGELLERRRLSNIRMAHAMSFHGAFEPKIAEWGEQREQIREQVLLEAAQIIRTHLQFGGSVYDASRLPTEKARRYQKHMLFESVVQQILQAQPENYVLVFMCDDEQDSAIAFYDALNRFKRQNKDYIRRIGGICFLDDVRIPQLQAADFVAYMLRLRKTGRENRLTSTLFTETTTETEVVTHFFKSL